MIDGTNIVTFKFEMAKVKMIEVFCLAFITLGCTVHTTYPQSDAL